MAAGLYAAMSYGLALIYGVLKIVNLANAGVLMLGAYVTWWLWSAFHVDPLLAPLLIVPLFFVFGVAIEWTIVRRVLGREPIVSLLLLFGFWLVLQNLAYVLWTGDTRSIDDPFIDATLKLGGMQIAWPRIYVFAMGVAILIGLQLFLGRTQVGRAIRALAQDRAAAKLVGIDVDRVSGIAFGLGIALAGLGGSLLSLLFSFNPDFGRTLQLKSFCIVVLGGLESIVGVAFGSLALALAEAFGLRYMPASMQNLISFVLLVVVLIAFPKGIAGLVRSLRRA
ncbi:MAG TPA: branched-chain amino acid ABC transporter permease [Candidatus Baltobacteraceae bacterium]|nr:branched-chain amino acid ABC transporter permease [Candidatus Baltobacteraceae bacterium]